ncbi:stage II sporulation protein P [Gracilibacillus ureilyticus]|uniref:Stage II sporulation protein P n=1 Tax=Gracilibacillus ureilyticus TaxID=531814 RepID=A0A1H9M4B0_9BACI|nr:stage II sporulation protein P [Gracilibacillus ureilyticus]SER18315.1 stage II sporulation protein P [Gracilibacillus ureilyticus]
MNRPFSRKKRVLLFSKHKVLVGISAFIFSFFTICIIVGVMTSLEPSYRVSSATIKKWTSNVEETHFLSLLALENRIFKEALPKDEPELEVWKVLFEVGANIRLHDVRSLLSREIPGFSTYDNQILIAGEGTDYTNLTVESNPPLDVVLEEREATMPEEEPAPDAPPEEPKSEQTTGEKEVVFIYNTHNRESFLPHLPDVTDPNGAFHHEVNITKVSDQLAKDLEKEGIGTTVDRTDIGSILVENGWDYSAHSYKASKSVVETALTNNKDLNFVFDLHRDSMRADVTTKELNGKKYAKIMFVIGGNNPNYEQNLALASALHQLFEQKYPGLSRGVQMYDGAGRNGVYNQDVSGNALTIEFGGVDNTMEELYNTSEVFAEVFSEYYWDAEKVSAQ